MRILGSAVCIDLLKHFKHFNGYHCQENEKQLFPEKKSLFLSIMCDRKVCSAG
jgi:hypothetical protein